MGARRRIPLHARDGSIRAYALVDPEDFERFGHLRWSLSSEGYAVRKLRDTKDKQGAVSYLHREILGLTPGDGLQGEHRNRKPCDCRRSNLRIAKGSSANLQNTSPLGHGTSGFRGVCWHKKARKWQAYAMVARRQVHLGLHETVEAAAAAAAAFRREHMPFSEEAAVA